jgi:hypothetical protein
MISFTRYISEDASKGLKGKAEKSGMPLGILRKVYNRGVAAWKSGHRPGTTPEQWGMARVNSFTTKSSGTWGKADKDLAQKVRKEEMNLDEAKTDIYHKHMLKALGKSRLPKNHSYTSMIANNGDFVVKDGGGRTVGRIAKGDHNLKEAALAAKVRKEEAELDEAYKEPQGQAKRMMSPLQKARMDKEKTDRDRDGKLMNVKRKPKTEGKTFNDFREANTPVGQRDKMKITDRKPHPDGGHIITLQTKTGKTIKRHLKNGKVKDLEEAQLAELTAAEKKLVNQMYDKKGNLTPLGKKVMDHNKKPGNKAKG